MKKNSIKKVTPSDSLIKRVTENAKESDRDYIRSLEKLDKSNAKEIFRVLSTVAAVIAIVVLVTVWALIGRGIRGTEPVIPSDKNDVAEKKEYFITRKDREVIDGKESLQSFFDDYMNGKACKLDIFEISQLEGNKRIGHSFVIDIDENGTGVTYYQTAANAKYTAYPDAEYYYENYAHDLSNPLEIHSLRFAFTEFGIDFISFAYRDSISSEPLDMSFIENSYENGKKVFDESKAKKLEEDSEAIYEFLENYYTGSSAFLNFGEYRFQHVTYGNDSVYKGPQSAYANCVLTMSADRSKGTVDITVNAHGEKLLDIATLDYNEAIERGIFWHTAFLSSSYSGYSAYHNLDYNERLQKTQSLVQDIRKEVTADAELKTDLYNVMYYRYLTFATNTTVYIYQNDDGTLWDTLGVSYPSYPKSIHAYKVSNELINKINESITEIIHDPSPYDNTKTITQVANELKFEMLPSFEKGERPAYEDMRYYAYAVLDEYPIKGKTFNEFTQEKFGILYDGIEDDYNIPIEIEGYELYYLVSDGITITHKDGFYPMPNEYEVNFKAYDLAYNETNRQKFTEFVEKNSLPITNEKEAQAARDAFMKSKHLIELEPVEDFTMTVSYTGVTENDVDKIIEVKGGMDREIDPELNEYRRKIEKYLIETEKYEQLHTHKLVCVTVGDNRYNFTLQYTTENGFETGSFTFIDGECTRIAEASSHPSWTNLSDDELAKAAAKNLGVPDSDSITYEVSESFYWDVGQSYYKNVDFYENGEKVAGASVEIHTGELLKNIWLYNSEKN